MNDYVRLTCFTTQPRFQRVIPRTIASVNSQSSVAIIYIKAACYCIYSIYLSEANCNCGADIHAISFKQFTFTDLKSWKKKSTTHN